MTVDKVIRTTDFSKAYKKLKKAHRNDIIKKIDDTIVDLINFKISTQLHNHSLKGKDNHGINDIHIADNVVLLYKYDSEVLIITLILKDIVNQDELKRKY